MPDPFITGELVFIAVRSHGIKVLDLCLDFVMLPFTTGYMLAASGLHDARSGVGKLKLGIKALKNQVASVFACLSLVLFGAGLFVFAPFCLFVYGMISYMYILGIVVSRPIL